MDLTFTLQNNTILTMTIVSCGVKVRCFMLNPANISGEHKCAFARYYTVLRMK